MAADDPSGESCADDPPNRFPESGISRSDALDSISVGSTSFDDVPESVQAMNAPAVKMASVKTRITNPTGNRPPRTPDFHR